ncbi:MAG: hypothetical protein M0T70_04780 [Geobacteraceae bacterium]|nr:hypothetical protein [Geobacteraceae bacterium]
MPENPRSVLKNRTDKKQRSDWPKLLDLVLRSWHVGASSVLFGAVVWGVPFVRFSTWHHLTIASGCALIISGICRCRHWPYQGRGLMAAAHIGLIALIHGRPDPNMEVLAMVLVAGVVGSHLPGNLRHWSLLHGRRID